MPRYLTQHSLACLTRQGAEVLARRMQQEGTQTRAERVPVNMIEGQRVAEFIAESVEVLEARLRAERFISIGCRAWNGKCATANCYPPAEHSDSQKSLRPPSAVYQS